MTRSKKKAISQKLVNVATTGMPSGVRKFLGNRVIAFLIVLSMSVLLAAGVVAVKWENGRPKISINRQKAEEVKKEAAEKIQELREERGGGHAQLPRLIPHTEEKSLSRFVPDWQPETGFGDKVAQKIEEVKNQYTDDRAKTWNNAPATGFGDNVAQRIEEVKDQYTDDRGTAWNVAPAMGGQEIPPRQAKGPLSRLKERIESRRR